MPRRRDQGEAPTLSRFPRRPQDSGGVRAKPAYSYDVTLLTGDGTDKLTGFDLKSGYSALRTAQTRIAVSIVVDLWGNTRQSEWRRPTPAS